MNKAAKACRTAAKVTIKKILGEERSMKLARKYREKRYKIFEYRTVVDVLFINGCDPSVPHPPRYRVTHQREQLEAFGITTDERFYTIAGKNDVKYANAFIIFRCPFTNEVGELIEEAHRLHKPVYFDVDDLVIDTKYTNLIPYVKTLDEAGKRLYDDGVNRMGKTLKMCDGAITTTAALAAELKNYVPDVIINRNTASDEMYKLSNDALKLKDKNKIEKVVIDSKIPVEIPAREADEVRIGYFSGSITHNADVGLIIPALAEVLGKHKNVKLYLVGELDLPDLLQPYSAQIVAFPFLDWKKLPSLIAMVDINLAPLVDDIFNRAKSENKWTEAALVKVVTAASNVGAFSEIIENDKTGLLFSNEKEWSDGLEKLISDKDYREKISECAYEYVKENCITIYSGRILADFIRKKVENTVVLLLPSTEISGGIMVALQHLNVLYRAGFNITLVASNPSESELSFDGITYPVIYEEKENVIASYGMGIATMWVTVPFLLKHSNIKKCFYLVQNYETNFYEPGISFRKDANSTYQVDEKRFNYVTISKWCEEWLKDKFGKEAKYIPNGIELKNFPYAERKFVKDEEYIRAVDTETSKKRKIRILIEGDSAVYYKGVDDSFRITNSLDKEKYEIWYMSYNAGPKSWYHVDKFLSRVPYDEVGKVYLQCDILLKSSTLESFSYPPLEMMATGGFVVAVPNGGNQEYLSDHENCLFYKHGETEAGKECIEEITNNLELRDYLQKNVKSLLTSRDWKKLEKRILETYVSN